MVRQGFRVLIEGAGDISIIAEAKTGREAVELARTLEPDVIVMDIAMPHTNGIQATQQILVAKPKAKILILSAYSNAAYVEQIMNAGAMGYVLKQASCESVTKAIREIHLGRTYFSGPIGKRLRENYQKSPSGVGLKLKKQFKLTARESELLQLIAEGNANKQIAAQLGISIKTVEKHRQHLMEKLNIHEIAGLTRFAISSGIIESSIQPTTTEE
jgi:DNA-binding NarL/FixJ family response regulator